MPQPLPNPHSISMPHRVLLMRPALAARIAAIAAQWTAVEQMMVALLGASFGHVENDAEGESSVSFNWIAAVAIREAETIRSRLKIMDATLGATLKSHGSPLESEWGELRRKLVSCSKARNTVVHGVWGISDAYPNELILSEKGGRGMAYAQADFDEILDRIVDVWLTSRKFQFAVLDAKLSGPDILRSM